MRIGSLACAVFLLGLPLTSHAANDDGMVLLRKVAHAAHDLNYTGTFVYQYDNRVETSKITHYVDRTGEYEKFETLNGPLREVVTTRKGVLCYSSVKRRVRVEPIHTRSFFPALLPERVGRLKALYTIQLGDEERVAGRNCQVIWLMPKDGFRYGHKLCADTQTGLLLSAAMFKKTPHEIDRFSFTQLNLKGPFDRAAVSPNPAWRRLVWHRDASVIVRGGDAGAGWEVKDPPPGFEKIMELRRTLPGKKMPVTHLVYSDGLVAVSVFIEPLSDLAHAMQGLTSEGVINIYARPVLNYQVTVLGEVPAATVTQMADSVAVSAH